MKATITDENMLGILYGAEKYMLPGLMAHGEAYVLERINESNCLSIFNATHLLNCHTINGKCVAFFRDNPWNFFKDTAFHKLSLTALKKLAGLSVMNCMGSDMKTAVVDWFVANGYCKTVDDDKLWEHGFVPDNFRVKKLYNQTRKGGIGLAIRVVQCITTNMILNSQSLLNVSGAAILASPGDDFVKLTISQGPKILGSIVRHFEQSPNFAIIEVFLEKPVVFMLAGGTVSIKIEFINKKSRGVLTNGLCFSQDHHDLHQPKPFSNNVHYQFCTGNYPENLASPFTCLAYLIYKN
jgi:hypothetical protein